MNYKNAHPWFMATFENYTVPEEMKDAFWNYLAYGWLPGGFGMAILRNDFYGAVSSAHRSLSADHLRSISMWLLNCAPPESFGTEENIKKWTAKTMEERRDIMIEWHFRPSVVDVLKGVPA